MRKRTRFISVLLCLAVLFALLPRYAVPVRAGETERYEFAPTRKDAALMLHTLAGKPEPQTDVSSWNEYEDCRDLPVEYRKAIAWVSENRILIGVSVYSFAPEQIMTRAQFVTVLYRTKPSPLPDERVSPFDDVRDPSMYYYDAVIWAAAQPWVNLNAKDGRFFPGTPLESLILEKQGDQWIVTLSHLHEWQAVGYDPDPPCQTGGIQFDRCIICGKEQEETIPAGHSYESTSFLGKYTYRCVRCGTSYEEERTEALSPDEQTETVIPYPGEGAWFRFTPRNTATFYIKVSGFSAESAALTLYDAAGNLLRSAQQNNTDEISLRAAMETGKDYYCSLEADAYSGPVRAEIRDESIPTRPVSDRIVFDDTRKEIALLLHTVEDRPEPQSGAAAWEVFPDCELLAEDYSKAIVWAYENVIMQGTDVTTFSPDRRLTRGQFVTYLWRTAGQPEPETAQSPFADVQDRKKYYYNAAIWASTQPWIDLNADGEYFLPDSMLSDATIEKNEGTWTLTFGEALQWQSLVSGSRKEVVLLLHAMAGAPEPSGDVNTWDVFEDCRNLPVEYRKAIKWAVDNEITKGTSEYSFSPDYGVTRAQFITFLWRSMGKPKPQTADSPYTDTNYNAYYYEAVLWSTEQPWINTNSDGSLFLPERTLNYLSVDVKGSQWYITMDEKHEWAAEFDRENPPCLNGGEVIYRCVNCGKEQRREQIPAGHVYTSVSKMWITRYECIYCGRTYEEDNAAALVLDRRQDAAVPADANGVWVKYTAEETALYYLTVHQPVILSVGVYDSEGTKLYSRSTGNPPEAEFSLLGALTAGKTYYYYIYGRDTAGRSISVSISRHPSESEVISGVCGENLTWSFNEATGALTITGSGAMTDWEPKEPVWIGISKLIKTVSLPEGLTHIGDYSFFGCDALTSFIVPENVTSIGTHVFNGCFNLKSLYIKNDRCAFPVIDREPSDPYNPNFYRYDNIFTYEDTTTIYGGAGSNAEFYAQKMGYAFGTNPCEDGHEWDEGTVTKEPTETAEGVRTFTCLRCGETKTEAIAKLEPKVRFNDVPKDAYYAAAVDWAVSKGITKGTTATTFSPGNTCTRAQVATFLWRAKGSPAPEKADNPFTDVKDPTSYYYSAVGWAVEQNITSGTGATTFSPGAGCTRAQVVTFLWRAAGRPEPTAAVNPFADVKADAYYYKAVLWAVEKKITTGTSKDRFSPDSVCTRGQIVTFLYRDMAE